MPFFRTEAPLPDTYENRKAGKYVDGQMLPGGLTAAPGLMGSPPENPDATHWELIKEGFSCLPCCRSKPKTLAADAAK